MIKQEWLSVEKEGVVSAFYYVETNKNDLFYEYEFLFRTQKNIIDIHPDHILESSQHHILTNIIQPKTEEFLKDVLRKAAQQDCKYVLLNLLEAMSNCFPMYEQTTNTNPYLKKILHNHLLPTNHFNVTDMIYIIPLQETKQEELEYDFSIYHRFHELIRRFPRLDPNFQIKKVNPDGFHIMHGEETEIWRISYSNEKGWFLQTPTSQIPFQVENIEEILEKEVERLQKITRLKKVFKHTQLKGTTE